MINPELDLENIEIFADVVNKTDTYYFMATQLNNEYELRTPALMSLDEVLSHAGECDNDSILAINDGRVTILYKWLVERNAWQMTQ
jgi:hypothetical protein